jgi:hypothetical protein
MATDESAPGVSGEQPAIVEIECAELRTIAHLGLNAVELTVVDPSGKGFRTWLGSASRRRPRSGSAPPWCA